MQRTLQHLGISMIQSHQILVLTHQLNQLIPLQMFLHKMILLLATSILPCTSLLSAA